MGNEIQVGQGRAAPEEQEGLPARGASRGRVLALVSDLMFGSKIREVLTSLGLAGEFLASGAAVEAAAETAISGGAAPDSGFAPQVEPAGLVSSPALLIVDLGDRRADPLTAIRAAASRGIPVLAYGSHVDEPLLAAAREAGAARVVPRSMFASRLTELITEMAGEGAGE